MFFAFLGLLAALQEWLDYNIATDNGQNAGQLDLQDQWQLVNATGIWLIVAIMSGLVGIVLTAVGGLASSTGFGLISGCGIVLSLVAMAWGTLEWNTIKGDAQPGY